MIRAFLINFIGFFIIGLNIIYTIHSYYEMRDSFDRCEQYVANIHAYGQKTGL